MDNIYLSFMCIMPIMVYLMIGLASRKLLRIRAESFLDLNKIVFNIYLPASLFLNIYTNDFNHIQLSYPLVFALVGVTLSFLISMIIYGLRRMPDQDKSVMIQASFRSNFILFGLPLTQNIMGGQVTGLTGLMVALIIPLFNVLATIVLSIYAKERRSFIKIVFRILKNPLIIASLLGFVMRYAGLVLPEFTLSILESLSAIATPLALLALGGRFSFSLSTSLLKKLVEALFVRLIFVPAICLSLAVFSGIRGEGLALLLSLFAGPVAVTSYTMAQQMSANEKLAGQILVYSTLFSNLTLFIFISIFKHFGFF